ncbi:MAG: M48 family metalloprotease [Desulfarculaceae bacterium]|nr:M48 family metalloprotease [Desulfarculaceae bacterium]MCF8071883.1 M48 family metalloprotease [Desulfarculaceae bacterium]MCF8101433.1 M48 family metalloprotease [Desulfarculaceae bacterium]MCF8118197.1 M48 family metalloprotease [Desulfarculaceae bacterium]
MALRLLCLLLIVSLIAGMVPPPAGALITLEEERKIGRDSFDQAMAQIPLVDDPDIVNYVRDLAKQLEAFVPQKPFPFRIYVADLPDLNAFAIPGGYIFMFRGMMTSLESEGELAGVMAHEMGHVWRRHLAKRLQKSTPVNIASLAGLLAGLLLGGVVSPALGQAVTMGSIAGGVQQQLAFSREDEQEADWAAFKTITAAGYPPKEMEKSFHRIWKQEQYLGGDVPVYLRTHPTSPQRIENMANMTRVWGGKPGTYDNHRFMLVQTRLISLYDAEGQAKTILARRRLNDPKDPFPIYGLALLAMRQHQYDMALGFLQALAKYWPNDLYQLRAQGVCLLLMGQNQQAERVLQQALDLRPDDQDSLLALGQAYQREGKLAQARGVLDKLVKLDVTNHAAMYELGVTYGRLGQVGEASLYLGLAFKHRRNYRSARYHLNRAVDQLAGKPQLQQKAQNALEEIDDTADRRKKKKLKEEEEQQGSPGPNWSSLFPALDQPARR